MSVPGGVMSDQLSQMDPQKLQGILSMANNPQQAEMLQQQMAQANALRQTKMPGMGGGGWNPRVQTAPSPLAITGALASRAVGQMQANDVRSQQQKMMDQNTAARSSYLDVIRQMMSNRGGAPGGGSSSGVGAGGGTDVDANGMM